jgi:hypothetical protein
LKGGTILNISSENDSITKLIEGLGSLASPGSKSYKRIVREGQQDFNDAIKQGKSSSEAIRIALKRACNYDNVSYHNACEAASVSSISQTHNAPPLGIRFCPCS